jgi:coproporphyrinogen III oxidase
MRTPDLTALSAQLRSLQDTICAALAAADDGTPFVEDAAGAPGATLSRSRFRAEGPVIERAAVHFTHARGPALPPAASARHPDAAGQPFEAVSLSLIVHPRNPRAPTTHMNLRAFVAGTRWWVGGGADLTPHIGFDADAVHWHRTLRAALDPLGTDLYPRLKSACDDYFFLPHRNESRGVGGTFFDDWDEGGPELSTALLLATGESFLPAYLPILRARSAEPATEAERERQLLRRGRYVEFNLLYDRGTLYGLQSGRRVESVLASLPPRVAFARPAADDAEEAAFLARYRRPWDWASGPPPGSP